MALSKDIKIGDKTFTARVLTLKQVREILLEVEDKEYRQGLIDRLFVDGLPQPAFYCSLGIEEKDIEELPLEQIKELMEAVAHVNPTYAGMEKRMSASVENMAGLESLEMLQKSLKEIVST